MAKKNNGALSQSQLIGLAAGLSVLLAVYLWFSGEKDAGLFVGLWVPSLLSFGSYIKK